MGKRPARILFAAVAVLPLPGCLISNRPYFAESADVVVPDFSGEYVSSETGGAVVVSKKVDNLFLFSRDRAHEPDEVVIIPLKRPGTYLFQCRNGEDYVIAAMLVTDNGNTITTS